jgi:plasmid stabilization system protein ParE
MERHPAGHDRFFDDFLGARTVVATFPFSGRKRDEIRKGLRSYVVHPYLVFYRVDEAARAVTVVRVIHGSMDFGPDDFDEDHDSAQFPPDE